MFICAAIQVQFERNGKKVEKVIHGLRHANCREAMAALRIPAERKEVDSIVLNMLLLIVCRLQKMSSANYVLMKKLLKSCTKSLSSTTVLLLI